MEDKTFKIAINEMMSAQFTFTKDDLLKYKMLTHKVQMPLSAIKEVQMKANSFMGTLGISIRYEKNGKLKKLQKIESKASDTDTKAFLEELQQRVPESTQWNDLRESTDAVKTNEYGRQVYPLQYLPFGYKGAGLPRGLQIGLIWGIFSLALFGLPVLIYMLVKKSYMVETDEQTFILRKFSEKKFNWDEIDRFEFQPIRVSLNYMSVSMLMRFTLFTNQGKKRKFIMRDLEAKPLMDVLAEKGFISNQEVAANFV